MTDTTNDIIDNTESVSSEELIAFCERAESVQEEIDASRSDLKEIKSELKGRGFDVKAFNQILKLRAMERDQRITEEAVLETYKSAVGLA